MHTKSDARMQPDMCCVVLTARPMRSTLLVKTECEVCVVNVQLAIMSEL